MQSPILGRIGALISETNLYIAMAAGLFAGSSYWMRDREVDVALISAVFFATLFTYNLQRRIGDLESPTRFSKVKNILMVAAFCGLLPSLWFLSLPTLFVLFIAFALSFGYAFPFLPNQGEKISLRQVPHAKIWIIVAVWILACVVCPYMEMGWPRSYDERLSLILAMAQQGSLVFALTLCFDIRDLPVDAPSQKTIPMRIGVARTLNLARVATSVSLFAAIANYMIGYYTAWVVLAQFAIVMVARRLFKKVTPEREKLFYDIYIDGVLIFQGIAALLASMI